mgnify:CR=1 FL=1|tara:strand:- start:503 stop:814 length:312 start_codon:yes stop_codon:yes gene_type:complete
MNKLLEKAKKLGLPGLYHMDGKPAEEVPTVKFFAPWGGATWYASEMDVATGECFGYCDMGYGGGELGYFSLNEMNRVSGPGGLKVEIDKFWKGSLAEAAAAQQ